MPRPPIDTPTRRLLMQGVMWLILGATVGLAAIVSHVRHSALEIKLSTSITQRGITFELPSKWAISKNQDLQSPVLLTATEPNREDDEGGRVIRIVRDPLATRFAPLEYARDRLNPGDQVPTKESDITIADFPGIILSLARVRPAKSLEEMINGGTQGKVLCAAAIPPSGHAIAIELEGPGPVQPEDLDLLQRIATSIKVDDEPELSGDRPISVGDSIQLSLPDNFSLVKSQDAFLTVRQLRPTKSNSDWRSIDLVPIVLLPKDGRATLLTMLSLYDNGAFDAAAAEQDQAGVWRVNTDNFLPLRAYAVSKNGTGLLAIFHGGSDSAWIDAAWQSMRDKITFSDNSKTDDLIANGADEVKQLRETGLAKLLPDSNDDLWWLNYIATPNRPIGWMHLTHGATNETFEQRLFIDKRYQELEYSWHGSPDFKNFRSRSDYTLTDLRNLGQNARQAWGMQTSLNKDQISMTLNGAGKPITYAVPPNYIPGGWLPFLLPKLPDRPMILRTDSFMDLAYVQPTDLLTVTIRPQPDTPRDGDDGGPPLHCVQLEFNGAGETSRWFFRSDGTLDGVDYSQAQHLIRRDLHDITMDFAHNEPLRPQKSD